MYRNGETVLRKKKNISVGDVQYYNTYDFFQVKINLEEFKKEK